MVPLKLTLRNFMAYRELESLDLSGIHVACLSGPNGAGKSALLDAITWALWGQARSRSDDDLVRLGESEMEVELEFLVGEQRYRIIRKRNRGSLRRAGQSVLELQIDAEGTFVPLTGNTLRETQRRIEELVRLDYGTFINSALLLQGRADEFTMKAPGERKRVLGEVLGLSRYDTLEERARDTARAREMELSLLRGEINAVVPEAAMRADYERELEALREKQQTLESLAKAQETALAGLQDSQRLRSDRETRLREAEGRIKEAEGEIYALGNQQKVLAERIVTYREVLQRREQVEAVAAEHSALAEEDNRLNAALRQLLALRERQSALQRTVDDARSQLMSQRAGIERDAEAYRQLLARKTELQATAQHAEARMAAIAGQVQEMVAHRLALEDLAGRIRVARDRNEEIIRQGKELRSKVEQLLAMGPSAEGQCPLCGTLLGPRGHARVVDEYEEELKRQRQVYVMNDREAKALEEEQRTRQAGLATLEDSVDRERAEAQSIAASSASGLAQIVQARPLLEKAEAALTEIDAVLTGGQYAPEAQQELSEVATRTLSLGYDEAQHRAVHERLTALEPELALRGRVEEAVRRLPEDEGEVCRIQEAARRWCARRDEEKGRVEALRKELRELPDTAEALAEAERQIESTRLQVRDTSTGVGGLEAGVRRCIELESLLHQKRQQASKVEWERGVYDELSIAFGRRGVQALLIETALPDLEAEANRLLGRMTDNRLALKLETQRQTRSGGVSETLDITIADELGTRSYELYSGGEAFRINFALRVALSRLLARRAGAPLPTLVIDEGFGTQDGLGREKLIEAINSIADDFRCLLVITHIEDVKHAFPVRIEVTKDLDGSRAEVVYA